MAVTAAWDRVHPRLTHRAAWLDHDGDLPVIEGTLIKLTVDHLPSDRDPKPVWLWCSRTGAPGRGGPAVAGVLAPVRPGTSARRSPSPPVRRNPASPAPGARQDQGTAAQRHAMRWEKQQRGNSRSRHDANAQVKRQANARDNCEGRRGSRTGASALRRCDSVRHGVLPAARTACSPYLAPSGSEHLGGNCDWERRHRLGHSCGRRHCRLQARRRPWILRNLRPAHRGHRCQWHVLPHPAHRPVRGALRQDGTDLRGDDQSAGGRRQGNRRQERQP
jgi:hypothetical protein